MNWKSFTAAVFLLGIAATIWFLNPSLLKPDQLIQEASPEQILDHVRELKSPLVLVNFWASWCEPCKVELPHILELKKSLGPQGLKVLFVSIDEPDDLANAEKFLKDNQVDFPTFYKGQQSLKFVAKIFPTWSGAVPATVLLGQDGKLIDAWEGETSYEEFKAKVTPHLKGI